MFDIKEINDQIDAIVSQLPAGKKVELVADANVVAGKSAQLRAALIVRLSDNVASYVRVTKPLDGPIEGDAGIRVSFLVDVQDNTFSFREVYEVP